MFVIVEPQQKRVPPDCLLPPPGGRVLRGGVAFFAVGGHGSRLAVRNARWANERVAHAVDEMRCAGASAAMAAARASAGVALAGKTVARGQVIGASPFLLLATPFVFFDARCGGGG